jgi:glyoxylase-like metal-dependent hydrolase (beta-lactamase superfamily II)
MRADSVLPVMEAGQAELVRDDHALDDHVRLAPTSGHTPHHVAVCLGRDGDDAVMPGDVLHSPLQARYPELSRASMSRRMRPPRRVATFSNDVATRAPYAAQLISHRLR